MRARWIVPLLLVTAAFTGCIGSEEDPDGIDQTAAGEDGIPVDWHVKALGDGHDHSDRSLHANLTTPNFETIGHDPLVTELEGTSPGGSSCGDVDRTDADASIAAQKAADSRGIVIADVSEPAEPQLVGELWLTFTHIYDVAVVPGGDHVALITSNPKQGPAPEPALAEDRPLGYWRSACVGGTVALEQAATQDPVPRPTSILLVDISDPSQPAIVDQRPVAGLGHGIWSKTVDERTWIVGITESIAHGGRQFYFNELGEGPTGAVIEPLSVHVARPNPDHAGYIGGHSDAWIQVHPKTGQTLAYLSAGPQVEIVDVSEPRTPERIAAWTDIGPDDPGDHNLHSLHPLDELWDGKHYTVLGPELGSAPEDTPSGIVWVLDTTDPAQPEAVAGWTLPAEVTWEGGLQFSTHYLTVVDQTLFVSMYHGGVWAVDLSEVPEGSPDDVVSLPSIGAYVPAREAPLPDASYSFSWVPNLEEVLHIGNGTLVTFDSNTGIYTFRFDATNPMPAPTPWSIEDPRPGLVSGPGPS